MRMHNAVAADSDQDQVDVLKNSDELIIICRIYSMVMIIVIGHSLMCNVVCLF